MPVLFPDDLDEPFRPGLLVHEWARVEGLFFGLADRLSRIFHRG